MRIIYTLFEGKVRVVPVVTVAAREDMKAHKQAHRRWLETETVANELTRLAAGDPKLFEGLLRRFFG